MRAGLRELIESLNQRLINMGWVKTTPQDLFRASRIGQDAPSTIAERFLGTMQDGPVFDAPERLKAPSFFTSDIGLRQHDRADWHGVDPQLQLFSAKLVEHFRKKDIPLYVHCALRTKEDQDAAFKAGFSKVRGNNAPHPRGAAVDIVHARYHWELTPQEWSLIGKVGLDLASKMALPIEWGGHFKSLYDPAHWQLKGWRLKPLPPSGPPIRKTPRKILRENPGGVPAPITEEQLFRTKAAIEAYTGKTSS